jgi:RecB family exonuclease
MDILEAAIETTPLHSQSEIDPRIKKLSYSSLLTLHSCPRKFQLYKLQTREEEPTESDSSSITFAFGHIVGAGIQAVLEGKSQNQILWEAFLGWDTDLEARNDKQNKSFYKAIAAIQRFAAIRAAGFYKDYTLVEYQGKPAVELSFADGFIYRGFVDAVLQHRNTGEILVLECKTSSGNIIAPAQFKNSAQAIGYSIVLDAIFPSLSAYEVLYLVYQTKSMEYTPLPFRKSYLQRALWIQELLLDIETIKLYEQAGVYPMRGESCYSFYHDCEYLNTCTLSTQYLTTPLVAQPETPEKVEQFQINITMADLIQAQLAKE